MKRFLLVTLVLMSLGLMSCSTTKVRESFCPSRIYYNDTFCVKEYQEKDNPCVLGSKRDYTALAKRITKGCRNDYERICAIYKWMCDNIKYDTSYEIYDADRCYRYKKGVCSAYCNLFYYIAKHAGVRTDIVRGLANNTVRIDGHVWIFAYINKNQGILLDPTWGAGSVSGLDFYKREDCWEWFNVDPKLMILTHFPDDESYQFLEKPVTKEEFLDFTTNPDINWVKNGISADYIFQKALEKDLSFPYLSRDFKDVLEIVSIPLTSTLKVGETYTFSLRPKINIYDMAIRCNDNWYDNWEISEDGTYTMTITLCCEGLLRIRTKMYERGSYGDEVFYDVKK